MPRNPNISISFSQNKFAQEVNQMASSLKAVRKEFEISNLAIEATGDKMALAENKLRGFAEEAKILNVATAAMKRGLDDATSTQSKLAAKTEAAKQAYQNAINAENKSAAEVERLKKEYDDLSFRLSKADSAVTKWNNKLQDAQIAENKLKVAVYQVNKEIDDQNKKHIETVKNTQNITSATGQLLNIYTLIKGLAVGYAGKTLFESLIGGNAQFEQYMASFEVLLGGADKAQKRMNELTVFAAKTPFELPQVVEAEKRLLAYGVAAEDTAKVMQMLGDISMGNAEKLNTISLAYGQVVTNQRLYGTELRQFAENGVPLLAELAAMYRVTEAEMRKMVEDGRVGADAVTAALEHMTSEGGKFYGMMDKQSQTMQGLWSTLKDNINMFARDVGENSFEYLKGEFSTFMDTMNQMSESGELGNLAAEWGRNIAQFVEFVVDAAKTLWDMKEALVAAGAAMAAFKISMAISGVISAVVTGIQGYITAVKTATTTTSLFNAVMAKTPWGLVASLAAAVVGGLVAYNLTTKDATDETNSLKNSIQDISAEMDRATRSASEHAQTTKLQIENAEKLIPELEELSNKTNRTQSENDRLNFIISQLNKAMPNLSLAIDDETGALNRQIPIIYATAEAYKKLAETKQIESEIDAYMQSKVKLQETAEEAYRKAYGKKVLSAADTEKIKNGILDSGMYLTMPGAEAPIIVDFNSLDAYNEAALKIQQANKNIADSEKALQDIYNQQSQLPPEVLDIINNKGGSGSGYTLPPLLNQADDAKKAAEDAARAQEQYIQQQFKDLKFAHEMGYISEADYYQQLAELRDRYYVDWSDEYRDITLEIKRYNDDLAEQERQNAEKEKKAQEEAAKAKLEAAREEFQERRQDSDNWLADRKYYNELSTQDEIAGYERIRKYVNEYFQNGVIDYKEYADQIRSIDKGVYDARKSYLEQYIKDAYDAEKKSLDAQKKAIDQEEQEIKNSYEDRKKAIEDYYDNIDLQEKQQDRNKKIAELLQQEAIYQNAATKEGRDRLKQIHEEIESLNKEAEKEQRDIEKKAALSKAEEDRDKLEADRVKRLELLNGKYEALDSNQQILMNNISQYANIAAGSLEQATLKIQSFINAVNSLTLKDISGSTNSNKTQAAGGTIVTINDYGNKVLQGTSDIKDYTKELVNVAQNAFRAGGG